MPSGWTRRLAAAIGGISLLGLAAAYGQDKTFELKLAHGVAPAHPLHKSLEQWGNSLERASGGTLKYKIYPSQELGKAFDHYDMVKDGVADLASVNPGYQTGRFPIINATELPFLVSDAKGGSRAIDYWYRKYAAAEMKDVKFCLAFVHDPGTFHSKTKKIAAPSDIKGMKVFTMQATVAALVEQLGGKKISPGALGAREQLEKGLADAATSPWGSVPLLGIDKVTKYHMEAPLYVSAFALVINKARYNEMSETQKKAIDEHCTSEWAETIATPWAEFERAGIEKLKSDPTNEVYTISDVQLAEWKKAAGPLEKAWSDSVKRAGGNAEDILKVLKGSLAEYKAAY